MTIAKLGGGGAATSDNCNGALKVKRLLVDATQEAVRAKYTDEEWEALGEKQQAAMLLVLEVDCWHHLRNVWVGAVTKELTKRLKDNLKDELDSIDFRLRVGTDMVGVLRAADKEFSLCANYPKGHGDMFQEWVIRCYPKALLFHVADTTGTRQDIACEGAIPLYMNRALWAEFLDERLRVPGDNILEENLYIMLTSVEMIASARIHSIIHLTIIMPLRWLAGNSHKLAEFDWSERKMGISADLLERAMAKVAEGSDEFRPGELMLSQSFMTSIFDDIVNELLPFKKYLSYMYESKQMALAGSSIKEHQYSRLREELFSPRDEDNQESTEMAIELGELAASTFVDELRDPKKATSRHLLSADGKLSWGNTSVEEHEAGKRKMAVNNPAESAFGATTRELHCHGRIGFSECGAVAQERRNGGMARGSCTESRKRKAEGGKQPTLGLFHRVSHEMRESLLTMAARDLPAEADVDRADLTAQRAARQRKEQLAQETGRAKASEQYVDALYYYEKWGSPACWKTAAKAEAEFAKLPSKSAKLEAVKEQIRIRVLGLGWADLSTPWTVDGAVLTPAMLMVHLKKIITEQARRTAPTKPPVPGLERKELPSLGTRTSDVAMLDTKELEKGSTLEAAARATKAAREAKGVGDSYQERQGSRPEIDEALVGKRIEAVCHYTLPDGVFGDALMWCAGEVIGVDPRPYTNFPKGKSALITWDANNRVLPPEPASTSGLKLLPSLWNKDGLGAWRMDLDPVP